MCTGTLERHEVPEVVRTSKLLWLYVVNVIFLPTASRRRVSSKMPFCDELRPLVLVPDNPRTLVDTALDSAREWDVSPSPWINDLGIKTVKMPGTYLQNSGRPRKSIKQCRAPFSDRHNGQQNGLMAGWRRAGVSWDCEAGARRSCLSGCEKSSQTDLRQFDL